MAVCRIDQASTSWPGEWEDGPPAGGPSSQPTQAAWWRPAQQELSELCNKKRPLRPLFVAIGKRSRSESVCFAPSDEKPNPEGPLWLCHRGREWVSHVATACICNAKYYTKSMNAINRQSNNTIPPDLQPYYDEQPSGTRSWARWLTRILAVVILVCLIALFVRWAWHQTHKVEPVKAGTSTSQKAEKSGSSISTDEPKDLGGTTDSNDETSSPATTGTTGSTSATTGNSGTASATVGQATTTTLANTGPGQTLAIFVAASLCFAFLYELRLRKQAN